MRKEYRRLFSLNLALLMLLTVMGPLSGPAAKASDDTVYTINGQSYTGDGSGKGWTYENNILTLEDYNGGAIDFPVGVTIQVSGACTVTAAEGAGISATLVEIKFRRFSACAGRQRLPCCCGHRQLAGHPSSR